MPLYHPKSEEHGFEIKTTPFFWKRIPFNQAFVAGKIVRFNISIKPIENRLKMEQLRIWRKFPGDDKYHTAPGILMEKYPNGIELSYKGELLTRKGDIEYVLGRENPPIDPHATRIHLISATVLHPDEQNNQLFLIFIAFLLTSICSLLEVLVSFLAWRFPN